MDTERELEVEVRDGVVYLDGKALESGSFVHGLVFLQELDIETLPERLTFFGELQIIDCPNLIKLPYRLVVSDGLNIEGCQNLVSIGAESYAGAYLTLDKCPKINAIPADMEVNGSLGVYHCGVFQPFRPDMGQVSNFATEEFELDNDGITFYDPMPAIVMQSVVGRTLRSFFDIPMIEGFPQMDRIVASFIDGELSGYPTARFA